MHDSDEICYIIIPMRQLLDSMNNVNIYDTKRGNSKSGYFKMQTMTQGQDKAP